MKKILIILLIGTSLKNYSQNIEGYVVTKSNDTIKCEFIVKRNIFYNTFYPSSVNRKAKTINSEGKKIVYKPTDLKSVFLNLTYNSNLDKYKFISIDEDENHFFHEKFVGKISYLSYYEDNIQGGSPIENAFLLKNGKLKSINGIINLRSKVGEYIIDYPELYEKWMDSNNHYRLTQIEEVVKLYNEYFKNKELESKN